METFLEKKVHESGRGPSGRRKESTGVGSTHKSFSAKTHREFIVKMSVLTVLAAEVCDV